MRAVHVLVPDEIDDPSRPSGGNTYDRRVCEALAPLGWSVVEHPVSGGWPRPEPAALAALQAMLERIADGAVVLIDGLIACAAPDPLVAHARRLRLVVLVHMPLGLGALDDPGGDLDARERAVLSVAAAVVTTSAWTRRQLLARYGLPADRVHVAEPGVDAASVALGSGSGGALLCVAAVTCGKGHDVLLDALQTISPLSFSCTCVGSLDRAPAFAQRVRERARDGGLDGRVRFTGPLSGAELAARYAAADLLVLPSRAETYGMVVTEALARGLPVVATDVGGVREALGYGEGRDRPGLLVGADDPVALGGALRAWLLDAELRRRLRRAARERRQSLPTWSATAAAIDRVLAGDDQ